MNSPVQTTQLPLVPADTLLRLPRWKDAAPEIVRFLGQLRRSLLRQLQDLVTLANGGTQGVGSALASASSVTPTHFLHHVTGTATIETIVAPPGFSGLLVLVADGAFALGITGNIAKSATATVGDAMLLAYDPVEAKWHPA